MNERPVLDKNLDSATFRKFYYLKKELICFCRANSIPITGSKQELNERIEYFLKTGNISHIIANKVKSLSPTTIQDDLEIENPFVCSEKHRAYFKERIGKSFTFNVEFQKWLKNNAGKTYLEAISAYNSILEHKKKEKSKIGNQFEYNTYIRDFFAYNEGRTLKDAIKCWNFKKSIPGLNRYERSDLTALD